MENICALATPYGVSAIAVIRASGDDSIKLISSIFSGKDLTKVKSHTINYGYILDKDNNPIDEVLCNVYFAPKSFDGENMVEINCHGGTFVIEKIIKRLLEIGFRLAERGEFSKRAFLNHKSDLTSIEAIMDVISSTNDIALNASISSLRKSTLNLVHKFRNDILDILAKIEVNIDYPEYEDMVDVTHKYLESVLLDLKEKMKEILDNSKISNVAIHGIKTAIVGRPNVGKSSLLNMMLEKDKAIVSNIPGTTRDLVEDNLTIGNVTLNLVDTAGIHETKDLVESIGIKRSKEALDKCDLVLLVLDSSEDLKEEDKYLIKLTENKNRIVILNKSDLKSKIKFDNAISISALKNEGMDILAKKILEITSINSINKMDGNYLNNIRQIDLMDKAYNSIIEAYEACLNLVDISLVEIDIKKAFDLLGEITGESYEDELLDALFTKFCLGK